MLLFMFKRKVMESSANGRVKRRISFFQPILFEPIISSLSSVKHDLRAIPLLDPGVLNCDESRSLRGVDMLLLSNVGSGDVSLPVELQEVGGGRRLGLHSHATECNPFNVPKALQKTARINPAIPE